MGFIYLSNLNIIPSNLEVVFMSPVAPLGSPEIIKSFFIMAFRLRPSLSESLSKSCEF